MAGHNKWSKIKRTKGALDRKRGEKNSRLSREITVATRLGGGNPAFPLRRRAAVSLVRAESMPNKNTSRAPRAGTGGLANLLADTARDIRPHPESHRTFL